MTITDELRKLARRRSFTAEELLDIADRIDEAHEEALREAYTAGRGDGMGMTSAKDAQAEYLRGKNDGYDEGWDAGFASADDWCAQHEDAMVEHGWYRVLDADKEVIHIGDVMIDRGFPDAKYTAVGIGKDEFFTRDAYGELYEHTASLYIHYKQLTVEDLLDEFVERWHDTHHDDIPALKAEYAAKLRLAGDAE